MIDVFDTIDLWKKGHRSKVADEILRHDKQTSSKILRVIKHCDFEIYQEVVEFLIFNRFFSGN